MPLTAYSQDSTKVANSTLQNFKRFTDKCDSTKVAYKALRLSHDSITKENAASFIKLEASRLRNIELSSELQDVNNDLIKANKKPFGNITSLSIGALIGIVLSLFLI